MIEVPHNGLSTVIRKIKRKQKEAAGMTGCLAFFFQMKMTWRKVPKRGCWNMIWDSHKSLIWPERLFCGYMANKTDTK